MTETCKECGLPQCCDNRYGGCPMCIGEHVQTARDCVAAALASFGTASTASQVNRLNRAKEALEKALAEGKG